MVEKKTTIYLIRHGECEGNKEKRVKGHTDFPLNEIGILQANALALALKNKGIQHIYSSPLSRAATTAKIICKSLSIDYETREEFNNICLGIWENRKKSDIEKETPELWNTWLINPDDLVLDGAETLDKVKKRSTDALDKIVAERAGQTFAIVGHRGILKPLLAGTLEVEKPYYWKFQLENGSYTVLTYDSINRYCLTKLNYTNHLAGIPIFQEFD